jgi:flagellar biogenesis protein FliO
MVEATQEAVLVALSVGLRTVLLMVLAAAFYSRRAAAEFSRAGKAANQRIPI